MPLLKTQVTEYEILLGEIKTIICTSMQLPFEAVSISFNMVNDTEPEDRYPSYKVGSIKVTVDNTKLK